MMQAVSQIYSSQNSSQSTGALVSSGTYAPGTFPSATPSSAAAPQSKNDSVNISSHGRELSRQTASTANRSPEAHADPASKESDPKALSQEDQKIQLELQGRDTEVRAHEQAHLAAAGQYAAGGASFTYVTGPDGKRYASGGEVPIDISKEKTPEATIAKMRTVRRAALAPANPSGADRGIAAQASSIEAQAMKEIQDAATEATAEAASAVSLEGEDSDTSASGNSPRQNHSTDTQNPPQISTFSRKTMSAAYENIAALAA